MIQQRVGDLLEVEEGGGFFYVVVLTRVVMFGGNILFAFHTGGERRAAGSLDQTQTGFNICRRPAAPEAGGAGRPVAPVRGRDPVLADPVR